MVRAIELTKKYKGNDYESISNVGFDIKPGECVAFLGPNGSGKTTLMRMLCGIIPPSSGALKVEGTIGYLPESNNLPDFLRAAGFFHLIGRLCRIPKPERKVAWRNLHNILDLPGKRKKISSLSQGNKRKLLIAQACIDDPDVLILDEPTVYLDLLVKHNFYKYLQSLKLQGKTVIISSHVLSEIEKLADRMYIFREGRILEEVILKNLDQETDWEYEIVKKIL